MKNKIIEFLKKTDGYLSGEELSRSLKISRAAIWKNIRELRKDGYDIDAASHKGYILRSAPDKLLAREIQYDLKTKVFGTEILHFDTVESTMDIAFKMGVEGCPEGTVICAEQQTKGRGRMGRTWNSPRSKGIYFSMILRPPLVPTDVAKITLLTAVAVCESIRKATGLQPHIKWPNDILINNKKVAGCLTELSAEMDRVRFVVVGLGINVNAPQGVLPETATSLKTELGRNASRIALMKELLGTFEYWYQRTLKEGFSAVIQRWKELSSTIGSKVRISDSGKSFEGEAIGLDEYGGLIIRNGSGEIIKRMTGDIIQV